MTAGAVLAGGAGRRLGGAKPEVELAGRSLIDYAIEAVEAAGLEPVVVAKKSSVLPQLPCRVLWEPEEPQHPLCGIVAALSDANGRPVVALACDMPLVTPGLLAWLAQISEPVAVPTLDGRMQPFPGRYDAAALAPLRQALSELQPMQRAIASLNPRTLDRAELERFGDPDALCLNVNTQADLATAGRMLATQAP